MSRKLIIKNRRNNEERLELTLEEFKATLRERLSGTDINRVKEDVLPFLNNPGELDIWSNDYFLLLADQMKIHE